LALDFGSLLDKHPYSPKVIAQAKKKKRRRRRRRKKGNETKRKAKKKKNPCVTGRTALPTAPQVPRLPGKLQSFSYDNTPGPTR
jgi:hypothetical protein